MTFNSLTNSVKARPSWIFSSSSLDYRLEWELKHIIHTYPYNDGYMYIWWEYVSVTFPPLFIMTYSHLVGIWRVGICWVTIVSTIIIVITIIIILTREKKRENPRTNKFLVEFKSTNCRLERPTLLLGWKLWFSFDNGDRKLLTAMIIPNMTQKIPPTIGLGMVRKRDPGNIFRVIFQSGLRNPPLSVQHLGLSKVTGQDNHDRDQGCFLVKYKYAQQ